MSRRTIALVCAAGLGLGSHALAEEAAPDGASPVASAEAVTGALEEGGVLLDRLMGELRARLMGAMAEGGPAAAIDACATDAAAITAGISTDPEQARVGRSSLKLRNPENAGPAWVRAWLEAHDGRPAAELEPVTSAVRTPEGAEVRILRPIAVQAPCLTCHGPAEGIPEPVRAVLDERYPEDRATGYAVGDLRGVAWSAVRMGDEAAAE